MNGGIITPVLSVVGADEGQTSKVGFFVGAENPGGSYDYTELRQIVVPYGS